MQLACGSHTLAITRPLIMGVLNVTPDSFSDGGQFIEQKQSLTHALRMIEEGADLIDIGGESTRPGAPPVSLDEERRRVLPVIEALAARGVPLSVDTQKPELMREAVAVGAAMVNDINGFEEVGAFEAVAQSPAAVCIMHKQGTPQTMQAAPSYGDVVQEVDRYLARRVAAAEAAGIARQRIVIDPGFGFGKTQAHNLALLRGLGVFNRHHVPVLAGLSRKSLLGQLTGRAPAERVHASVAAALIAVHNGANIVRVHDVAATRDALCVWNAVSEWEQPA
jgi:dihydropteroate synthase